MNLTCRQTVVKSLATGEPHSDVLMPSGQVLRGLDVDATIRMLNQGGICLPRERKDPHPQALEPKAGVFAHLQRWRAAA